MVDAAADPQRAHHGVALSFLAGYVDTVGFVALFGLFTAHVTGNFVLIGSELVRPTHGVLLKLLAFPAFVAAVALARMTVVWRERAGKPAMSTLFLLQLVLLLGFMFAGYGADPVTDGHAPLAILAGVLGAASMGVQNAGGRLVLAHLTPTTVMTGNVTQMVIDLVDIVRGAADDSVRARCVKFFWPVVAFGSGAIAGAAGFGYVRFWTLLIPAAILLALYFAETRRKIGMGGISSM